MKKKIIILLFLIIYESSNFAQQVINPKIVLGKVISEKDSLELAFTAIYNKNKHQGTFSDSTGKFSIYYSIGDTLVFSRFPYVKRTFVIEKNIDYNFLVIILQKQNIVLKSKIIYPWPSKEQFKDEFLNLTIVNPVMDALTKHFDQKKLIKKQKAYPILHDQNSNYNWFVTKKLMYK